MYLLKKIKYCLTLEMNSGKLAYFIIIRVFSGPFSKSTFILNYPKPEATNIRPDTHLRYSSKFCKTEPARVLGQTLDFWIQVDP